MFGKKHKAPTGIKQYERFLSHRYNTFNSAFNTFRQIGGRVIVELGTARSFVSGGIKGCMVNDRRYWNPKKPKKWDWGGGIFTRMCAVELEDIQPVIHSVDISLDAIQISRVITEDFPDMIKHHHCSSEDFLSTYDGQIDLLYMDAGETDTGAEELHLREAKIVIDRQLMSRNGIILIDDVNVPGKSHSKGALSIPFFCSHGFRMLLSEYQVLLQRSEAENLAHTVKSANC